MTIRKKPFENIVQKGERTDKQQFLLFPNAFDSNKYSLLSCGKEFTLQHTIQNFEIAEREKLLKTLWNREDNTVSQ